MTNRFTKAILASVCALFLVPSSPMIIQANYDGLGPVVVTGGKRDMQWPVPNYPNIQSCFYDHRNHRAIDIAAPSGTPVVAAYNGTVVEVYSGGTGSKTGYGNYVVVQHNYATAGGNITLYTRYNHLSATQASVGQNVSRGQTIGLVGMTGYAEGNHLDFQVYNGPWNNTANSIDPFSNQLLELPGNVVVYDSWDCGPAYLNQVRNLYATSLDAKNPVISNIQYVKDAKGYTITCTVEDESGIEKVLFPTWTPHNGQDDLGENWPTNPAYVGKLEGNKATFRVNIADHNNELGTYITDIYAFDKYGNGVYERLVVDMTQDTKNPVISNIQYVKDAKGYTITCTVEDESGIEKVLFPTWTPHNGQDDLGENWPANPAYVGKLEGNKATFRVNIADHNNELGTYITDIYAFDKYGNGVYERLVVDMSAEDMIEKNAMYRVYNPGSREHFYTASVEEKNYLTSIGWIDEGIGWYAPAKSDKPVYRLYHPGVGDHHYTMDKNEVDYITQYVGWKNEGIGWYSADSTGQPIYRQFEPNLKTGAHNYTANPKERETLISLGWVDEGIAWYGLK